MTLPTVSRYAKPAKMNCATAAHFPYRLRAINRILLAWTTVSAVGVSYPARAYFIVDNLTSSSAAIPAEHYNPNLENPWGMAYGPGGPLRVAETLSGQSEEFDGTGVNNGLPYTNIVSIPPLNPPPNTGPTGIAYNPTTGFLTPDGVPATFLFASLDGAVYAWTMKHGSVAAPVIANTGTSVFTGLAVGSNGDLYVARNGVVRVFDQSYKQVGAFGDPNIPTNYGPYNVRQVGSELIVTFTAKKNALPGGYVDAFDLSGNLVHRLVTNGPLDNPWGIDPVETK